MKASRRPMKIHDDEGSLMEPCEESEIDEKVSRAPMKTPDDEGHLMEPGLDFEIDEKLQEDPCRLMMTKGTVRCFRRIRNLKIMKKPQQDPKTHEDEGQLMEFRKESVIELLEGQWQHTTFFRLTLIAYPWLPAV